MQIELDDEFFGRNDKLRVFVSSKMRPLKVERQAAVEAIAVFDTIAEAWWWEGNAAAGPYCAEEICIRYACISDHLILILSNELSTITRKEYEAAKANGAQCYIFVKEPAPGCVLPREVSEFVRRERDQYAVTRKFANTSELHSHIIQALTFNLVVASRERIQCTRDRIQERPRGITVKIGGSE